MDRELRYDFDLESAPESDLFDTELDEGTKQQVARMKEKKRRPQREKRNSSIHSVQFSHKAAFASMMRANTKNLIFPHRSTDLSPSFNVIDKLKTLTPPSWSKFSEESIELEIIGGPPAETSTDCRNKDDGIVVLNDDTTLWVKDSEEFMNGETSILSRNEFEVALDSESDSDANNIPNLTPEEFNTALDGDAGDTWLLDLEEEAKQSSNSSVEDDCESDDLVRRKHQKHMEKRDLLQTLNAAKIVQGSKKRKSDVLDDHFDDEIGSNMFNDSADHSSQNGNLRMAKRQRVGRLWNVTQRDCISDSRLSTKSASQEESSVEDEEEEEVERVKAKQIRERLKIDKQASQSDNVCSVRFLPSANFQSQGFTDSQLVLDLPEETKKYKKEFSEGRN
eukprot:TRINITY_DN2721_c0_g2_i2.p1 TRINITY_DN2721_c0_g2~~TRINITY_DN2721_c0_g2_i2.p1  ORF type:complete len:393 (-),score=85.34 TRINITY_DN2721_c0_g2_i2:73-1251(-)